MSVADIYDNAVKAFFLREIDTSESKFSVYFLLLSLFILVRSVLVIGFRYKKPDFKIGIELMLIFLSFFQYCLSNLFFAFLIKFLSHKKDTPYKEILTVLVFGKIRVPLLILLSALFTQYTFLFNIANSILFTIYMYNNLKQDNKSNVWFFILLLLSLFYANIDMFDFESELTKFHGFYIHERKKY